jgi:hypothetical protein
MLDSSPSFMVNSVHQFASIKSMPTTHPIPNTKKKKKKKKIKKKAGRDLASGTAANVQAP